MSNDAAYIMAMSCAIPAAIGALRYKKIDPRYHPFIYMLLLVPLVETIRFISRKTGMVGGFAQLSVNLYLLINFGFFLSLVYRNGYIKRNTVLYFGVALLLTAVVNLAIEGTPFVFLYYLLCFASCLILLVCIDILSKQMMAVKTSLLKNCWFWISCLYVIQHAYSLLLFGIYIFSLSINDPNVKAIFIIYQFVNMACYLLFILAVLRIPKRKEISVYQLSKNSPT